jgi:hypothetical protein
MHGFESVIITSKLCIAVSRAKFCTEQVNVEINYLHLEETWRLSPMHILPMPW